MPHHRDAPAHAFHDGGAWMRFSHNDTLAEFLSSLGLWRIALILAGVVTVSLLIINLPWRHPPVALIVFGVAAAPLAAAGAIELFVRRRRRHRLHWIRGELAALDTAPEQAALPRHAALRIRNLAVESAVICARSRHPLIFDAASLRPALERSGVCLPRCIVAAGDFAPPAPPAEFCEPEEVWSQARRARRHLISVGAGFVALMVFNATVNSASPGAALRRALPITVGMLLVALPSFLEWAGLLPGAPHLYAAPGRAAQLRRNEAKEWTTHDSILVVRRPWTTRRASLHSGESDSVPFSFLLHEHNFKRLWSLWMHEGPPALPIFPG